MKLAMLQAAEKKLLIQTYERNPLLFVSGHGVYLTDEQGNDYLDLLSGIGVSALGYGNAVIEDAIREQSTKLLHTSNLFFHEGTADLALRLTEISGMDRVFFCNSGTEAWEAALKLARAHSDRVRAEGGRMGTRFLALEHSFHGRTIGSVATTHKLRYRTPFAPVMPDVEFVRFNDVEDLRAHFSDEVCGICIEVVQGEGGIHTVSKEFFTAARELCDQTGALLIADEIQCGFGRTGRWFGYQHFGIRPDVTTIAKPLAGGLPIGAMLATERAASAISPGMHGTTFGGGPLVSAVAIAVIDEMRKTDLLQHVTDVGQFFLDELRGLQKKHASVMDVRGIGLMLGIELESEELAKQVAAEMLEQRIILNRTSETVLRFLPPYILEPKHVEIAISALDAILASKITKPAFAAEGQAHG
jgi:acetylornithine/N-succinyldiaminopimelate aminotransferase